MTSGISHLAEELLGRRSHYGKTTHGVVRYGPDPVVAVVDSTRPGETVRGRPDRRHGRGRARRTSPTVALVGVAVAGGRLPPAWRGILRDAIEAGLDVEAGMHEFLADDPELSALAREHGVELRDLPPPARRPERPDRREPRRTARRWS